MQFMSCSVYHYLSVYRVIETLSISIQLLYSGYPGNGCFYFVSDLTYTDCRLG